MSATAANLRPRGAQQASDAVLVTNRSKRQGASARGRCESGSKDSSLRGSLPAQMLLERHPCGNEQGVAGLLIALVALVAANREAGFYGRSI
jgi:hypothetical protein